MLAGAGVSSGGLGASSNLILVVDKGHFLAAVGWRVLFLAGCQPGVTLNSLRLPALRFSYRAASIRSNLPGPPI